MATVSALVARTLRLLQVIDPAQAVKPHDLDTALVALNAMMARWEADGLALGWSPVSNPSQDLPVPDEALEAVAYNLAVKLAPEYGTAVTPEVHSGALAGLNDLLRDQMVATPIRPILDVPTPAAVSGASRLRSTAWDY